MSLPKVVLKHPRPKPNPEPVEPVSPLPKELVMDVIVPEKIYMVTEANIRVPQEVPADASLPSGMDGRAPVTGARTWLRMGGPHRNRSGGEQPRTRRAHRPHHQAPSEPDRAGPGPRRALG